MLNGFEVVTLVSGLPTMSVTKNGVGFNKNTVVKLDKCNYIYLMIDDIGKRLALQKTEIPDEKTTSFYTGQKNNNVRWNNIDLLNRICIMMSWDLNNCGYKIVGDFSSEDSAMIFDLNRAEPINE